MPSVMELLAKFDKTRRVSILSDTILDMIPLDFASISISLKIHASEGIEEPFHCSSAYLLGTRLVRIPSDVGTYCSCAVSVHLVNLDLSLLSLI